MCPTTKSIRRRFNPSCIEDPEERNIPVTDNVCMWGNSDIPYLQHMMSPDCIEVNLKHGVYFSKIGAKITETSQLLDLGLHFKSLKSTGRSMTLVGKDSLLTIMVDMIFDDLRKRKVLLLPRLEKRTKRLYSHFTDHDNSFI